MMSFCLCYKPFRIAIPSVSGCAAGLRFRGAGGQIRDFLVAASAVEAGAGQKSELGHGVVELGKVYTYVY